MNIELIILVLPTRLNSSELNHIKLNVYLYYKIQILLQNILYFSIFLMNNYNTRKLNKNVSKLKQTMIMIIMAVVNRIHTMNVI